MKRSGYIRRKPKSPEERDEITRVRRVIYERSEGRCERYRIDAVTCRERAPWEGPEGFRGEMHEKVYRSHGGVISEENSSWLCWKCHDEIHTGQRPKESKLYWSKP